MLRILQDKDEWIVQRASVTADEDVSWATARAVSSRAGLLAAAKALDPNADLSRLRSLPEFAEAPSPAKRAARGLGKMTRLVGSPEAAGAT
jgi:hypothetical protein